MDGEVRLTVVFRYVEIPAPPLFASAFLVPPLSSPPPVRSPVFHFEYSSPATCMIRSLLGPPMNRLPCVRWYRFFAFIVTPSATLISPFELLFPLRPSVSKRVDSLPSLEMTREKYSKSSILPSSRTITFALIVPEAPTATPLAAEYALQLAPPS